MLLFQIEQKAFVEKPFYNTQYEVEPQRSTENKLPYLDVIH